MNEQAEQKKREAKIIATVLGWGESADAHHLTQPHPQGLGAAAAIRDAIKRANINLDQISLIAAHATATPDNDSGEHTALANVFGEQLPNVPVVAFKSHVGHTLGGAGAVELILSAMALRDHIAPAVATVTADEVEFSDLSVVTEKSKPADIHATLNTSLGFGGANTAAILSSSNFAQSNPKESPNKQDVFITGIGVLLPGVAGMKALTDRMSSEHSSIPTSIAESDFLHLLNARKVRRLSDYVKYSLAATVLAYQDAGLTDLSVFAGECPVLLGTTQGSSSYCIDYYRQIVEGGYVAANPMLFAEGVPNAASAHHSLNFGLRGACQTVIGSRTAGLDALRLATLRISSGQWNRAIVGAGEESVAIVNDAYRHAGLFDANDPNRLFIGAGAITLLLENQESMLARGGRARAAITSTAAGRIEPGRVVRGISDVMQRLEKTKSLFTSANGTWIDRAEALAVRQLNVEIKTSSLHGYFPELLSAGPLASIAVGLSRSTIAPFTVISTGYSGTVAGVTIASQ